MEFCVFTKFFQSLDPDALGRTIKGVGADGVDLTVREGGSIDVNKVDVTKELPKMKDILHKHGLNVSMITTNITDLGKPQARQTIETAGKLGIKYMKLGYWKYPGFPHYRETAAKVKADLKQLEPVLKANGVKAGFHTHSAEFMGINANHVLRLLEGTDPQVFGVYYDTGHSMIEGTLSGWMMDFDLASDRIFMVAIKDLAWRRIEGPEDKEREKMDPFGYRYDKGWRMAIVTLDKGYMDFAKFMPMLESIDFRGPVSIHAEYGEWCSEKIIKDPVELAEQAKKDLSYAKSLMNGKGDKK